MPYLGILAKFRDYVRQQAISLKSTDVLAECDKLRDEILPGVGVRLEDRDVGPSLVKLVDRDTLLKEREAKKALELERQAEKKRKKLEMAAAQAFKDAQKKIPPSELFKMEADKYSQFDDDVRRTW